MILHQSEFKFVKTLKGQTTMTKIKIYRFLAGITFAVLLTVVQTAQAAPLVYVPLGGDDKIVVVDASTDKIVATISGVEAVHGLAISPDGRHLIAGSYSERETKNTAPPKPAGVSEDEHAKHHASPASGSGIASSVVSTVSIVQISDSRIIRRIDVPGAVHHVSANPDGRFAVVTHPNEGAISVIDLSSYKVITSFSCDISYLFI